MQALDRSTTPEAAKAAIDRLTFFSDAVVAIAMTLLAVDLPVPTADSATGLLHEVSDFLPEYLAFAISFLVIARYWRIHHRLFRYVADTPNRLVSANGCWLFAVIVTPYATRVLFAGESTTDSDFPYRFAFYAALQALAGLSVHACARVIASRGLLHDHAPPELLPRALIANAAVATTFLVSIPLCFVVGPWAFVLWPFLGLIVSAAMAVYRRRHPELNLR